MSNIVKVGGDVPYAKQWEYLRFTEQERDTWLSIGIVHPYIADLLRLNYVDPEEIAGNKRASYQLQKRYYGFPNFDQWTRLLIDIIEEERKRKAGTYDPRAVE